MNIPDKNTLKNFLFSVHEELAELERQNAKGEIVFSDYYKKQEELLNSFAQGLKLIFTNKQLSYGDLMLVEMFNICARSGGFIPYDGSGYYIDFNGNELGSINWYNIENYPKETVFVIWYNK